MANLDELITKLQEIKELTQGSELIIELEGCDCIGVWSGKLLVGESESVDGVNAVLLGREGSSGKLG